MNGFNFKELYSVSAKELNKIQKAVMSLIMDQELNKKVAIVTKIMHANDSAIFLSSKKDGEVEVEGPLKFVESNLKDLGINIDVKASYNMDHQFTFRAKETTPFFSVNMFLPEHPFFKEIITQIFKGKHPADPFPSNFLSLFASLYISGKNKNSFDISREILHKEIDRNFDWLINENIDPMELKMGFHEFRYALENITDRQEISNILKYMKGPYMRKALMLANDLFMNYIVESPENIQAFSSELYRPKHISFIRSFNQLDPSQTFSHVVTEKDNIRWTNE